MCGNFNNVEPKDEKLGVYIVHMPKRECMT
jgi:hypothetical protein